MMEIPRRLYRFPTGAAQDALAKRFDLPQEDWMQGWEYIVSDPDRLNEFIAAYEGGELSDDEKFSLMEMILDSIGDEVETPSLRWQHVLDLLDQNIELHAYSVCHWANLDLKEDELQEYAWPQAPSMRVLLERHSDLLGYPFPESLDEDEASPN